MHGNAIPKCGVEAGDREQPRVVGNRRLSPQAVQADEWDAVVVQPLYALRLRMNAHRRCGLSQVSMTEKHGTTDYAEFH